MLLFARKTRFEDRLLAWREIGGLEAICFRVLTSFCSHPVFWDLVCSNVSIRLVKDRGLKWKEIVFALSGMLSVIGIFGSTNTN